MELYDKVKLKSLHSGFGFCDTGIPNRQAFRIGTAVSVPSDCGNGIKRKAGFVQKLSGGQQGYPVKGIAGSIY